MECRLQVRLRSKPVFQRPCKDISQWDPITLPLTTLCLAGAHSFTHSSTPYSLQAGIQRTFIRCLLCARCYASNCCKVSHYKMKRDGQSKLLVQDIVSIQEAPSSYHTLLPNLTLRLRLAGFFPIPSLCQDHAL